LSTGEKDVKTRKKIFYSCNEGRSGQRILSEGRNYFSLGVDHITKRKEVQNTGMSVGPQKLEDKQKSKITLVE